MVHELGSTGWQLRKYDKMISAKFSLLFSEGTFVDKGGEKTLFNKSPGGSFLFRPQEWGDYWGLFNRGGELFQIMFYLSITILLHTDKLTYTCKPELAFSNMGVGLIEGERVY